MGKTVELVVAGPNDAIRAFVSGYLAGESLPDDSVIFGEDHGIQAESLIARIAGLVRLRECQESLLADETLATALAAKIKEVGKPLQLAVQSRQVVDAATMAFCYDAYNRELGDKLQQIVAELATRLALSEDYKPQIEIDVAASGSELYSPAHAVEIHASGRFSGPVLEIIAARTRLASEEMVILEPIQLKYA